MTHKNQKIYDYICKHYQQTGIPPTTRQIMGYMGYKSPRSVSYRLQCLREDGFLNHVERKHIPVNSKVVIF